MSNEEERLLDWKQHRSFDVAGNWSARIEDKARILKRQILNLSHKLLNHASKKMGKSGCGSEKQDTQGAKRKQKIGISKHQANCGSFWLAP